MSKLNENIRKNKYPKFIRNLLLLTSNNDKIPTDKELDYKIETLAWYMHQVWPMVKYITKRKILLFLRYRWKYILKTLIITMSIIYTMNFTYKLYMRPMVNNLIVEKEITDIENDIFSNPIPKENINFMLSLSLLESTRNYNEGALRTTQYWGMYQMGDIARKEIGLSSIPKDVFLKNHVLQNWAMNELMRKNYEYLKPLISKYNIPVYGGIKIGMHLVTISGLIAASHLVGSDGVKIFFQTNGKVVPKDGNGKPMTDYLQLNNIKLKFD